MNVELIAFTEAGLWLAERAASALAGDGDIARLARGFGEEKTDFRAWTARGSVRGHAGGGAKLAFE
ncbi:MAG: hypothetical protein ABT01_06045 [Clostridium sp. SCN 57-10]|nr:MAG: hypothetical protein ABT01_06045 [Clostridium sp. SCN 57-10]